MTLGQVLDFLLECHRAAPFLMFNGNIFGEISRRMVDAIFMEFSMGRRREAGSMAAHYVAGVLDKKSMEQGLMALSEAADFKVGDRVRTLRGSLHGVIRRVLPDGRIAWLPDGQEMELVGLPESMIRE